MSRISKCNCAGWFLRCPYVQRPNTTTNRKLGIRFREIGILLTLGILEHSPLIHTCIYTHIYTYKYIRINTYNLYTIHTYNVNTYRYIQTCIHPSTHSSIHTYNRTYIHTCTYMAYMHIILYVHTMLGDSGEQ